MMIEQKARYHFPRAVRYLFIFHLIQTIKDNPHSGKEPMNLNKADASCGYVSYSINKSTITPVSTNLAHMKPVQKNKGKVTATKKKFKKVNVDSLDASFEAVHRTKMSKDAAVQRRAAKIVKTGSKARVPSKEVVERTGDDLSKMLKDF